MTEVATVNEARTRLTIDSDETTRRAVVIDRSNRDDCNPHRLCYEVIGYDEEGDCALNFGGELSLNWCLERALQFVREG